MDQMTIYMIIWILAILVFSVIEIATAGLATIWFVGGALVALVASFFEVEFIWQVAVFVGVSFVMLFALRPYAVKRMFGAPEKTNVDSLVGEIGFVVEPVSARFDGQIKVGGQVWTAFSEEDIKKGENVVVEEVRGVKLFVKKQK